MNEDFKKLFFIPDHPLHPCLFILHFPNKKRLMSFTSRLFILSGFMITT